MNSLIKKLSISSLLFSFILSSFGLNSLVFAYSEYSSESCAISVSAPGWHKPIGDPNAAPDVKVPDDGSSIGADKQVGNESPPKILSADREGGDERVIEELISIIYNSDPSVSRKDIYNAAAKLLNFGLSGNLMAVQYYLELVSDSLLDDYTFEPIGDAYNDVFNDSRGDSKKMEGFAINLLSLAKTKGRDQVFIVNAISHASSAMVNAKISVSAKERLIPLMLDLAGLLISSGDMSFALAKIMILSSDPQVKVSTEDEGRVLSLDKEVNGSSWKELADIIQDSSKEGEERVSAVADLLDRALSGNPMAAAFIKELFANGGLDGYVLAAFGDTLDQALNDAKVNPKNSRSWVRYNLFGSGGEILGWVAKVGTILFAAYKTDNVSVSDKEQLIHSLVDMALGWDHISSMDKDVKLLLAEIRALRSDPQARVSTKDEYRIFLLDKRVNGYSLNEGGIFYINKNYSDDAINVLKLASAMYQAVSSNSEARVAFKFYFGDDFNNRTVFYLIYDEAGKMRVNAGDPAKTIQDLISGALSPPPQLGEPDIAPIDDNRAALISKAKGKALTTLDKRLSYFLTDMIVDFTRIAENTPVPIIPAIRSYFLRELGTSLKKLIAEQTVNDRNRLLWDKFGVVMIEKDRKLEGKELASFYNVLSALPSSRIPPAIALIHRDLDNIWGMFLPFINTIIFNPPVKSQRVNSQALFHEIAHYWDFEQLTPKQSDWRDRLWNASKNSADFGRDYGMSGKLEDFATMIEAYADNTIALFNQAVVNIDYNGSDILLQKTELVADVFAHTLTLADGSVLKATYTFKINEDGSVARREVALNKQAINGRDYILPDFTRVYNEVAFRY